jgi:hypothetical protein
MAARLRRSGSQAAALLPGSALVLGSSSRRCWVLERPIDGRWMAIRGIAIYQVHEVGKVRIAYGRGEELINMFAQRNLRAS